MKMAPLFFKANPGISNRWLDQYVTRCSPESFARGELPWQYGIRMQAWMAWI